jgi:hypothetical protein
MSSFLSECKFMLANLLKYSKFVENTETNVD